MFTDERLLPRNAAALIRPAAQHRVFPPIGRDEQPFQRPPPPQPDNEERRLSGSIAEPRECVRRGGIIDLTLEAANPSAVPGRGEEEQPPSV